MLYLTCTTLTSVDLAHYRVSRAKDWASVDCGTKFVNAMKRHNASNFVRQMHVVNVFVKLVPGLL